MKPYLTALLFLLSSAGFAQSKRIAHWYFGYEAGVDFSTGTAQPDMNGKLTSIEGCSAISDVNGNLLFYSNGETVWDRSHTVMPYGSGLHGDQSSTQSSLIVPLPDNNNIYYLFSSVGVGSASSGLYYNIVDMSLRGGMGDVTSRDNPLFSPGTEQLAGTMHCNAKDYWIIGRENTGDLKFYAYLLTKDGLSAPVISEINGTNGIYSDVGTVTISTDGKIMALTTFFSDIFVFDFDNSTGAISMRTRIASKATEGFYGNAISPDNSKLYTTSINGGGYNYLSQFDLTATNIAASRVDIDSTDYRGGSANGFGEIGQIRLAPDQKIYVSRWNQDHPFQTNPNTYYSRDSLDVIYSPDLPGLSCNFRKNYLYLHGKPVMLGLPNFISNYASVRVPVPACPVVVPVPDFAALEECRGQAVKFTYTGKPQPNTYPMTWDFGDPDSGPDNVSSMPAPLHTFTRPAEYKVSVAVSYPGGTVTKDAMVKVGAATVNLGADTSICAGDILELKVRESSDQIKWQDNSSGNSFTVHTAGKYYVTVTQHGCVASDTILVGGMVAPSVDLGPDLAVCADDPVILTPLVNDTNGIHYAWQDGSVGRTYKVVNPGVYSLRVLNACGNAEDVVEIKQGFCDIYVPSAFTPNGDGHNDVFKTNYASNVTNFSMTIYDRWGMMIFRSNDMRRGWDGFYNGIRQPEGTYVWMVQYDTRQVKGRNLKGTLLLIY